MAMLLSEFFIKQKLIRFSIEIFGPPLVSETRFYLRSLFMGKAGADMPYDTSKGV